MSKEDKDLKTFRVRCGNCDKHFHVRFPLQDPEAKGEAEVVVDCLYCGKSVMICLPRIYVEKDVLTRGLDSVPVLEGKGS